MEGKDPEPLYALAVLTNDVRFPPPPGSPRGTEPVPWRGAHDFVADLDQIIRENQP